MVDVSVNIEYNLKEVIHFVQSISTHIVLAENY